MARSFDMLVLGGGVAGLSFALEAAQYGQVAVLTKRGRSESNTLYFQGGIAAVLSPQDSFDAHIQDTIIAGAGLNHRDAVELVVKQGPDRIKGLIAIGTEFTRRSNGELDLTREGGHTQRRVVHAGDISGREV